LNILFVYPLAAIGVWNGAFTTLAVLEISEQRGSPILRMVCLLFILMFLIEADYVLLVNAIIFLAPISVFDQALAEVNFMTLYKGTNEIMVVISAERKSESVRGLTEPMAHGCLQ
jgi:hypothetical protein